MITFVVPVKMMEVETKSGVKDGKEWSIKEAVLFVQDVGRVKVPVYERNGVVKLPEQGQMIRLRLSVAIGPYQSLKAVWDNQSVYEVVTPVEVKKAA